MKVIQIPELVNQIVQELTGEIDVTNQNLSEVVDTGRDVINTADHENFTRSLMDMVGKTVFVNRPYQSTAPSVLMDATKYGSIVRKIQAEFPESEDNPNWAMKKGDNPNQFEFNPPTVSEKFFNSKVTHQVPVSLMKEQVESAFTSAGDVNAFLAMIETQMQTGMSAKSEGLIRSTINNRIADTFLSSFGGAAPSSTDTSTRAVNLLKLYKDANPSTVDPAMTGTEAINDPEFIRYATFMMRQHMTRLRAFTTLYNEGGKKRHTPSSELHFVTLSILQAASETFLQSDTYHKELVSLPYAEDVPFWQGTGTAFDFESTSSIDVTTKNGTIKTDGILAVMFDRNALGVMNSNLRVEGIYAPNGGFYNQWYKADASYFNDANENFVVFFAK